MNNGSFLKHALVYGTATLFTSAANFLLTPLFTRCLTREEYGAQETLCRCAEFVGLFMLVGGLRQGLMTLYQQKVSEPERRRTVGAALFLITCASLLVGGVMFVCSDRWGASLREDPRLLGLAITAIVLEPFHLLPLALMQVRLESTRFVLITVCHFVTRVSLSVLFVRELHWGVAGVLGATALTGAVFAVLLIGRELWLGVTWPDWRRMRGLLRFALPILPSGLCFFVMQHGDRFFLKDSHGNAEVATYSLGYKLAQAVATFSLVPLYMVWSSHMYAAARQPDAPVVFGRAFTRILAVFLFVGLGVSVFESEAVWVLGGAAYGSAVPVIAPVLLASFFQSAASLMDSAFYVCHRTRLKLAIAVAATLVMTALYVLWIRPYGSMGAALATLVGFAFLAGCTWRVTQRFFPVSYEWGRLGGMLSLAVAFWLLSRPLPATPWLVPVKAALWLAWPVLLWYLGLVSDDEKRYAVSLLRRPLRRTAPAPAALAVAEVRG
jgi:O-antigen/teichoic acid export membrane protein